jgi:DNA-binding PadR family transcriptional regulator
VRAGILALLAEQGRNGYQIMQELERRSGGVWHPSPGSIYPSLQQLEDEGLVRSEASGTGRTFELTDQGRRYVAEHADEVSAPWAGVGDEADDAAAELMAQVREVAAAAAQVARAGDPAHLARAKRVLASARRELYRVLADEPDDER